MVISQRVSQITIFKEVITIGTRSCVVLLENESILMVKQLYRGDVIWTTYNRNQKPDF